MLMGIETMQIMDIIKSLPLSEKMYIAELIFKDMREQTLKIEKEEEVRKKAAQLLLEDYQNDRELTVFTALDKEGFYETE